MAYKTKAEKRAWRRGLFAGLFGRKKKKDASKVRPKKVKNKNHSSLQKPAKKRRSSSNNPFGMSYYHLIREEEQRKRDLLGDFEYDHRGRIKGGYTPDGIFEPD